MARWRDGLQHGLGLVWAAARASEEIRRDLARRRQREALDLGRSLEDDLVERQKQHDIDAGIRRTQLESFDDRLQGRDVRARSPPT
jgi:hypothetical protein